MTGRDLVTASLRLIGAVAPGESIAASEATDGLATINRMIDSWSNEGLLINAINQETPLTLTAGDGTITLGTSGDIANRPMSIESALIRDGSTDHQIQFLSLQEFSSIQNKNLQTTYPGYAYDDGGYPLRTITLYPVPSADHSLVLFTKRSITQISTLDTVISLPPGYERALVYNGAIELCADYGRTPSEMVFNIANESKASIKRSNHRPSFLRVDSALLSSGSDFDFESGGSR